MQLHDAEVYRLKYEKKLSYEEIMEVLNLTFGQVKHSLARERQRLNEPENLHEEICAKLIKGAKKDDLLKEYKLSSRMFDAVVSDLKEDGLLVEECGDLLKVQTLPIIKDENKHPMNWDGNKIIRFGIAGDKQFNSKYTQITYMHQLYDLFEREGIDKVFDPGDLDEGEKMRKGHEYECYNQGADDHIAEIVKNHPYRKGITTYFITGNHDHSLLKLAGYDIGIAIAKQREDMVYLGQSFATVELTPNCTLELRHPLDGTAYAISYKIQKMVEAISAGEKPNILAVGHYHKAEYLFYRNIHCIQTGCLQGQTQWMRGKGISAALGGWIIEAEVDKEGTILRFKMEFIPFYSAIKDDYKNWR